ncbi:protein ALTERED PHOSPHATE STARVATION RESPONSE 1-like [Mangifera indica]|uniref:protein ALTERED PHOSPHATE STARVATION RESPONSE 1-like n=1 Tax=Mangifera indica TaxID=29780 RepID=UPI001CF930D6|nr:protein ALTERED PHOSPHATE STARVATION RESPONSE 1-like [Mangifera indica]
MGCTNSKLDDLPAVALCRNRCGFLDEAIQQRYLLAETHVHYVHSLEQMGHSLRHFINQGGVGGGGGDSPTLNLPPAKKGGDAVGISVKEPPSLPSAKVGGAYHSHSNPGDGHIQFVSDPDDDDEKSGSGNSSPLNDHDHDFDHHDGFKHIDYRNSYYTDREILGGFSQGGFTHTNYMKNQPKPPIVFEQKPYSSETIQHHYVGESSSASTSTSYYPPHAYPYSNSLSSSYFPPSYGYGVAGGPGPSGAGGYYGLAPPGYGSPQRAEAVASSSKPPPPPPSPPQFSAWDFLNPFESYDKFYPSYALSMDSKELREKEGIPDLEEEDYSHEVKKVHVEEKFVDGSGGGGSGGGGGGGVGGAESSLHQTRPSVDNEGVEYEVHVVDQKVVDEERNEEHGGAARAGPRDVFDVARELEVQFVRASESGTEIAELLEVGKLPYQRKHVSKMLHVVTPSLSVVSSPSFTSRSADSSSSADKADPALLDIDKDMTRNLSSTLHKLYLWEKKLYHEVKNEEKMRVIHDRKVRKLKRLDERGAEAHKVDSTRTLIRNLSIKIGMAIQVVDKISMTINKIRDEELWPQLNELIQGLTRMWKSMLECHHSQCQSIRDAKGLGLVGSGKKLGDSHLDATSQLEREVLNWIFRFSSWIGAQKGYVRALNCWLMKCLLYEPEETADGIAPFSPGRMGAPPIFVICNQWSQALDRISEKEVIDSMQVLAMIVLQLWEHDKEELRQKMEANKDYERKVRSLDREGQKIQKEIQALDKKIVLVSGVSNNQLGHIVYQSDTRTSSLQGSLQRIFEAMERFTGESVKAYEELLKRTEEELHARQNERVS